MTQNDTLSPREGEDPTVAEQAAAPAEQEAPEASAWEQEAPGAEQSATEQPAEPADVDRLVAPGEDDREADYVPFAPAIRRVG